jgi:hypothetical protein
VWQGPVLGRDEDTTPRPSHRTGLADFPHPALQVMNQLGLLRAVRWTSEWERCPVVWLPSSRLMFRGKQLSTLVPGGYFPLARSAPKALRQSWWAQLRFGLLSCPCLPWLHGHYPASWLLWRLCQLPGTALRTPSSHEHRHCSRLLIPDSRHHHFQPFRLQRPPAFPFPCSLSRHEWVVGVAESLRGSASDSGLRLFRAGSPMQMAESSSTWFSLFADWSFASGCSPPHLSMTQLPSATRPQCLPRRGLSPLCDDALSGALERRSATGHSAKNYRP